MWDNKSTLLVELEETSHILKTATSASLVLIDELGRGTSSRDGEAIARETLKHIMERIQCTTVFITHFR